MGHRLPQVGFQGLFFGRIDYQVQLRVVFRQLWVVLKPRFIGINSPFKRMWKRQEQCYDFLAMEHRDFMIRIYGDLCGDMTIWACLSSDW